MSVIATIAPCQPMLGVLVEAWRPGKWAPGYECVKGQKLLWRWGMSELGEFELRKTLGFEAAHRLPGLPAGHKCTRLHGHSFKATFVVRGRPNPATGLVMDYADIKAAAEPVIAKLDHYYLNEIPGLENPSSEVLCQWIYDKVKPALPALYQVIVSETCTSDARYPV